MTTGPGGNPARAYVSSGTTGLGRNGRKEGVVLDRVQESTFRFPY
jgi:hypothetical protein